MSMGATTEISWTHATFNAWRGCTKVSAGCAHCYAETLSHRNPAVLGEWGPGRPRVVASESYWRQPQRWHDEAVRAGERRRVFCASLADVFDSEAPVAARRRLWAMIQETSGYLNGFSRGGLDWLILTKRPERIGDVLREDKIRPSFFHDNRCWVGVSVESQEYLRRFWAVEHWSPVPWISAEPLLGPLLMPNLLSWSCACGLVSFPEIPRPDADPCRSCRGVWRRPPLRWIVAGGESGRDARPMHPDWPRSIRDQCQAAGVPFHFKQNGEWASVSEVAGPGAHHHFADGATVRRVGKKAAGRLLDGRTWDQFPAPAGGEVAGG
jgi:protein gp37